MQRCGKLTWKTNPLHIFYWMCARFMYAEQEYSGYWKRWLVESTSLSINRCGWDIVRESWANGLGTMHQLHYRAFAPIEDSPHMLSRCDLSLDIYFWLSNTGSIRMLTTMVLCPVQGCMCVSKWCTERKRGEHPLHSALALGLAPFRVLSCSPGWRECPDEVTSRIW